MILSLGVEEDLHGLTVTNPDEAAFPPHGPGEGITGDPQMGLDVVQEAEGVFPHAVALVHQGDDGKPPLSAHAEKLPGLSLHTLAVVQKHDGAVRRCEGPVGILGEVLVARGVQKVDTKALVVEAQHAGGDGDAPLPLHIHPVGGGVAVGPACLHGPGQVNGPAEKEKLFGEGGLPGVGMTDDGEGAPSADLPYQTGSVLRPWLPQGIGGGNDLFHSLPISWQRASRPSGCESGPLPRGFR